MKRNVLVTGGAGFLGRNLTSHLRASGWSVQPLDDLSSSPDGPAPWGLWRADVLQLRPSDLAGLQAVVHLAACKSVPWSFVRRDDVARNVLQDRHLLETAAAAGVPLVLLASSCEIYGRRDHSGAISEDCPYNPMSPYAVSKVALEYLANVYRSLAPASQFVCVRLFNIYGPDEGDDAVVPRFIRDVLQTGRLMIEGDGRQERDFSYIDDVVQDLGSLMELAGLPPTINIGSGSSHAIRTLASLVIDTVGAGQIGYTHERPNEIREFRADTTLLRSLLGRRDSRTALDQGIIRCVQAGRPRFLRPQRTIAVQV
jgi:nucleoside-diphosphate-sugar epimerase